MTQPFNICVTGACGQIAYSLLPLICTGRMLGAERPVRLSLLDLPGTEARLEAVEMELVDCSYSLLRGVRSSTSADVAFRDQDLIIFLGAFPRLKGMERADLLTKNAGIFSEQGAVMETVAPRHCRSVVVGNPANTNCATLMRAAPSIPRRNFTALTRLDQNRAVGAIAERLGVEASRVRNVVVWGNHSATQFPDTTFASVHDYPLPSQSIPVTAAITDHVWLRKAMVKRTQQRGAEVIAKRGMGSCLSAANAVADHVRDWFLGTKPGTYVSMAVVSDKNSYDVPSDLIYSFPVTCRAGEWSIVDNLALSAEQQARVNENAAELLEERRVANSLLKASL